MRRKHSLASRSKQQHRRSIRPQRIGWEGGPEGEDITADVDDGSTNPPNFADLVIQNKKLRVMPLGGRLNPGYYRYRWLTISLDSITVGFPGTPSNGYRKQLYSNLNVDGNTVQFIGSQQDGDFPSPRHEGQSSAKISTISSNADRTLHNGLILFFYMQVLMTWGVLPMRTVPQTA